MASKSRRGFASMEPDRQKELASKGGRTAHAKGTAHEFTSEEAREAGRRGGETVSRDRAHMSAIGREGGYSRGRKHQEATEQQVAPASNETDSRHSGHESGADRESGEAPIN